MRSVNLIAKYFADCARLHAKFGCQRAIMTTTNTSNFSDIRIRENGKSVSLSPQMGVMGDAITLIAARTVPSKISSMIMRSVTIVVAYLRTSKRTLGYKNGRDQAMQENACSLAVHSDGNAVVSSFVDVWAHNASSPASASISDARYNTTGRDGVIRRKRDDDSNIIGIIGISHSEFILRCGQGLALLTQRLRPAFYSRFTLNHQGATA